MGRGKNISSARVSVILFFGVWRDIRLVLHVEVIYRGTSDNQDQELNTLPLDLEFLCSESHVISTQLVLCLLFFLNTLKFERLSSCSAYNHNIIY